MHLMRSKVRGAFTLVEILIVVIILGILAAIVVPQFTNASDDAQAGNVATQLSTIRNQVELYRARNSGQYPALPGALNDGWDLMIDDGFLKAPPMNPRNNSTVLVGADDGVAGWYTFDSDGDGVGGMDGAGKDTINATWFDEIAFYDGDPATLPWTGP
jgi:general secretion pathway protein G